MIISRTPYRISFVGGGSDYPAYYENYGVGEVISTTINKYCHISCHPLPPFYEVKHKIVWSKVELVNDIMEIEHPVIRESLQWASYSNKKLGLEIHHIGDLPARSGMGSSSSFTVGLTVCLLEQLGLAWTQRIVALRAIDVERHKLGEYVGDQDQFAAAFGGFNHMQFRPLSKGGVKVMSLNIKDKDQLESRLMLFYTGIQRIASKVAAEVVKSIPERAGTITRLCKLVRPARFALEDGELDDFGRILHEAWMLKRQQSSVVSNMTIDSIYEKAIQAGALGGKLLGAGAGGFMLFYVPEDKKFAVTKALSEYKHVPFKFESEGVKVWNLN